MWFIVIMVQQFFILSIVKNLDKPFFDHDASLVLFSDLLWLIHFRKKKNQGNQIELFMAELVFLGAIEVILCIQYNSKTIRGQQSPL